MVGGQKSIKQSTIGNNNSSLVQSVFESQVKRQYRYANYNDLELCERETLRMLQILRHLFYGSREVLISQIANGAGNQKSQYGVTGQRKSGATKGESVGDKLMALWG